MSGGDSDSQELVVTTVRLTEAQKEWIDSNQSFNLSGFVRECIEARQEGRLQIIDKTDFDFGSSQPPAGDDV